MYRVPPGAHLSVHGFFADCEIPSGVFCFAGSEKVLVSRIVNNRNDHTDDTDRNAGNHGVCQTKCGTGICIVEKDTFL